MEFGRIDCEDLDKIDFTLPPDKKETTALLQSTQNSKSAIHVGCAKWGRKDWVGKIYPPKTKEADFLYHYAKHFDCIELNATYYTVPTQKQIAVWRSKVGDDFKFYPKFPKEITHTNQLKNIGAPTERFLTGISGFGKNLGPVFFICPPDMGPENFEILETFIQSLPKDLNFFVELRNQKWFSNPESFKKVFDMMQANNIGAAITDASGRRDCVHMRLTTQQAFIRFVGNGLHPTDYTRIDDWVQRIKVWINEGIEQVHFFMHQHEEIYSPELARYVIQQLNKHCGTSIPEPKFIDKPPTLNLFGEV
jgi:uncharacterized protein YecE (DUF72 family)